MSDNTPLKISPPRFDSDSQSDSETYGEADSMQVLLDGQEFYKIKRSGKPSMRRVSVSQSFHKLFIEKNDSEELKTTAILTSDITSIESGFESRLTPALLKRFFNCRQYGFRIFTRKGSFELSTEYYKIRGVWVRALNKLKELAQQWSSHNGFKTLWATQCTLESLQKDMLQLRNQNARLRMEMADRDIENTSLRKQIVTEALEEVLERILTSKSSREKELERKLSALQLAYNSVKSRQTELKLKRITREQGRGWVFVLSMLNFRELFKLRQLSTKHMDLVHRFLSNRSHWTLLARGGLHPRYVSWPLYIRTFHGHSSVARQQPLTEDTLIEITRDIGRTMSNCKEGIEEVLLRVCGTFEDVGYCQGMNLVVEFLFSVLPSNNQVLGAFMVLMRPPYFFSELWQPGFPRLKLLMFQLNVLLSIKVPTLTRHFSNLDIQLDMLAPSWFLTLFSSIESLPKSVLLRIWDMFWVDGWKAVLSATLTLLHLSQMNVLGHNFERTLQYFSHFEVTLNDFVAFLPMFQVDEPMLESLERAFYLADGLCN